MALGMLGRGIVVGLALGALLGVALPSSPPPGDASATPAATGPGAPTMSATQAIVRGERAYGSAQLRSPTATAGQSKVWYHDGTWWAVLADRSATSLTIQRLDPSRRTWTDTGAVVDDRITAHPDVFADRDALFVAAAGTSPGRAHQARFSRFDYDAAQRRYVRAADFPVALTESGVASIQVARDTAGTLWVAYLDGTRLVVRRDTGSGVAWSDPLAIAGLPSAGVAQVSLIARAGRVAVITAPLDGSLVRVAVRADADPPERWTATEARLDADGMVLSTLGAAASADGSAIFVVAGMTPLAEVAAAAAASPAPSSSPLATPNPFSTAAPFASAAPSATASPAPSGAPNQFATAAPVPFGAPSTAPAANPLAPRVVLLALASDGTWRTAVVGRVTDLHTRPLVVVDDDHARVWVLATAPGTTGAVYAKSTAIDHLSFASGRGLLLADGPSADGSLRFPTTTKQGVGAGSGLLVLASDDAAGVYAHAWVSLSSPADANASPSVRPPGELSPAGPVVLIDDRFDAYGPGIAPSGTWVTVPAAGAPSDGPLARTASRPDGQPGTVLRVPPSAGGLVACRAFDPVRGGVLTVDLEARMDALPATDVTLSAVRAGSVETASVRFDWKGVFAYYRGADKIRTNVRYAPGTWYRSVVRVDLRAGTYDWTVTTADAATPVLAITGIAWRSATARSASAGTDLALSGLCVRGASGPGAAGLLIDSVRVEQPGQGR